MRLFSDVLRSRVSAPLSRTSMARDLQRAPANLATYLDRWRLCSSCFGVRPWHRNIVRATVQAPMA